MKIRVVLEEGVLKESLVKILDLMIEVEIVSSDEEADIVIFSRARDVEKEFNEKRPYIYLDKIWPDESTPRFPENVEIVPIDQAVPRLFEVIGKAKLVEWESEKIEEEEEIIRAGAKSILVIDDTIKNIQSAKRTLAGHRVATATGYEEAMDLMKQEKFDVVLTDLYLPMSSNTLSSSAFELGKLVPYGLLLMVEAARQGVKYVAVVTDLNHHADPFSAAFDHFSRFSIQIEESKVLMLHARVTEKGKDWANALKQLLG